MPRLLILCEYPTLLGGERSMLATLAGVRQAGFDVQVAAPVAGPLADALRSHDVHHLAWDVRDPDGERLPLPQARDRLAELVRGAQPGLLHANSLSMARLSGPVAQAGGTKSIGHLRDIVRLSQQAVDDLNCHDRLLAVSAATRDHHVEQGVDIGILSVAHNGVDLGEFRPREATGYLHRELGLAASTRLVLTVGQLGLRKAVEAVLAAAMQVAHRRRDIHWLLVGQRTSDKQESRDYERLLRNIAAQLPLAGRVHFLGTRTDVARLMSECVLLVHAARQEPLGRVLLEAAACGLPTVATDVGGTREIFPSEADGAVLVPSDDRQALADAMATLTVDDNRREALGLAGRRRAEAAFDIRQAAARLVEHYRDVLGLP